ncbi:Abortive infection protein (plasmid) [Ruminococcus albus 7 = DSM 20455]|uniref:Abortive infection protein n=1 Tax=Ruminococcus albus (strain ATCC 27210 / DSM 20455 / JCM 14654 / NCDO 2250 / 7) TaxID=697329 RepID=E6UL82_RUMA7|nr:Abortive infection protein [Ruminococcus albus 7 = DSM 20455]
MTNIIQSIVAAEKVLMLLIAIGYFFYLRQKRVLTHSIPIIIIIGICSCLNLFNHNHGVIYNVIFCVSNFAKLYVLSTVGYTLWKQRKTRAGSDANTGILSFIILLTVMLCWGLLMRVLIGSQISEGYNEYLRNFTVTSGTFFVLLNGLIIGPISEEIYYRCFYGEMFMSWTDKMKYSAVFTIFITAISFSLSHISIYSNDLMKMIQVFPIGIILGYVNYKKGVLYSIPMHILYNTGLLLIR